MVSSCLETAYQVGLVWPCGGAGATAEDCRRSRLLYGIQDLGLVVRDAVAK